MAQQNRVHFEISDKDWSEIIAAVDVLAAKLFPLLTPLTAQERSEIPKVGERSQGFLTKGLEYAEQNLDLVPAFMDLDAVRVDIKATLKLLGLERKLSPILQALEDTIALSGSEGYQGILLFYANLKNAVKVKAGNSIAIYEDLSSRFPGRPTTPPKKA